MFSTLDTAFAYWIARYSGMVQFLFAPSLLESATRFPFVRSSLSPFRKTTTLPFGGGLPLYFS